MRHALGHGPDAGTGSLRVSCALHAFAACSVATAAREVLDDWHWASYDDPPQWVRFGAVAVAVLYEVWVIIALVIPSLGARIWPFVQGWMDRHGMIAFLGLLIGWGVVYWVTVLVGCAAANLGLLLGRLVCFPVLLISRWGQRLLGCWRVLTPMLDVLERWLSPDDTIRVFGRIMPVIHTAEAVEWGALSPAQTVSRLLELRGDELLNYLPARAWPELINPELSPDAMGILFCRSLRQDGTLIRGVSDAVVSQDWFSHPVRGHLLCRELAALPSDRLTIALETISEISRPQAGHTMRSIVENVQGLGDADVIRRFQVAMTWAPAQVCEDIVVCT